MVALSRCLPLLLASAEGARVSRKKLISEKNKFIAGVPVLNYHTAYGGAPSFGEVEGVEQEWVVVVKPGATDDQLARICKSNKNGCNLSGHPSKGGVPFVEMRGTEKDLENVIKQANGAVRYVEPDSKVSMIPEIEADAQAATWGLDRIGADERGPFSGVGATVFILDTGVRVTHQEFNGRAASALDMTSGSPVECNGNLNCASDAQGHGSHCAGSAAGETVGVAPSASIRAIKVLGDDGSGSWSWSYGALDWLATSPVRPAVGSMSLGGSGTQQAMADAVNVATGAGVTIVVAGGNSNSDSCNFSPAFVPSAITVGSTTSLDARSSFSNYGPCTNIWGPGSSVRSVGIASDTAYATYSGTSMACPHVAGGVALLHQANPNLTPTEVLAELTQNGEKDAITDLQFGDVNVLLSVREPYTGPPTPAPPTPAPPPPGTWELFGSGCQMEGDCISSLNFPAAYGMDEACNMQLWGDIPLRFDAFDTEGSYDVLRVGATPYSGTSGPASGSYSGSLSWASDYSVSGTGWKFCRTDGSSPPSPTPAPTTAAPTPTNPAPTPTPAPPTPTSAPPAPTPSSGSCSSWCEPPADCVDYPYSCSGCCDGSPSPPAPPAPSPPSSGDCLSICDRETDCTNYPSICGGCSFC